MQHFRVRFSRYVTFPFNGPVYQLAPLVFPLTTNIITVFVAVHPVISVPNQLVGAPLGTDVTLECILEAFPKAICYWIRDNGTYIIPFINYRTASKCV